MFIFVISTILNGRLLLLLPLVRRLILTVHFFPEFTELLNGVLSDSLGSLRIYSIFEVPILEEMLVTQGIETVVVSIGVADGGMLKSLFNRFVREQVVHALD